MVSTSRAVHHLIDEQVRKWEISRSKKIEEEKGIQVITISREPGSGGRVVAGRLAEIIGFDLFHQELVNEMAESAKMSERILQTLDEKGLNLLQEWSSYLIHDKHLWPDQYLKHLIKVIGKIDLIFRICYIIILRKKESKEKRNACKTDLKKSDYYSKECSFELAGCKIF